MTDPLDQAREKGQKILTTRKTLAEMIADHPQLQFIIDALGNLDDTMKVEFLSQPYEELGRKTPTETVDEIIRLATIFGEQGTR